MTRLLLLALLVLPGCASAPNYPAPGPCVVTACGDTCCNNDGKLCPACPPRKDTR